jgi:peptidoglycan/LPS O-acetylase OafA/YrhL
MVSGFILSYSEMRRLAKLKDPSLAPEITPVAYVERRLGTMLPIYLVGMFAAIITAGFVLGMKRLPSSTDTLNHFLLIQSWTTPMIERGLVYLTQCWFMSCLLFYWFIFHTIYSFVASLSTRSLLALTITLSIVIPLTYELVTIKDADWYSGHQYSSSTRAVDVATTTLKYHPLAYLHIFTLGCCLPRVRELLISLRPFQIVMPFLSLVAYGALLILYCAGGENVPGYKLSFRLGLFSCLQALLLIALCNKSDLLARLFCHPVFKRFGLYSYPQYMFQFVAYAWYSELAQKEMVDIRYFLLLFSTAVISWTAVSRFNGNNMKNFVVGCLPFLVMYLILQPFLSSYDWTHLSSSESSSSKMKPMTRPVWWNDSASFWTPANDNLLEGVFTSLFVVC